jgi:(hydroxyamino)benzene mutase
MNMEDGKRRLLWHGMFLFLLGLLTGFVETSFQNPRMGLAAHLEGVMNGAFLVALGAIWSEVRLQTRQKAFAYWTVLYGTYGNWAFTTLAALLGTAALSPITAAGHRPSRGRRLL